MTQGIVCLVGPTATGKTALAMQVAAQWPVEIVSADSRQVYRTFDLGTAKPTLTEQAQVRHHGLDVVEPTGTFDAARFAALARGVIPAAHARGRDVLVVGGTGLYLRALLRGLSPVPPRSERLQGVFGRMAAQGGAAALHRWLAVIDPVVAARVHPNDSARIIRGLEVAFNTGRRLSSWQEIAGTPLPWPTLQIGLEVTAATLASRIECRVQSMLASGWVAEVERLCGTVPDDAPAWQSVGYRELRAVVRGEQPLGAASDRTLLATRQFAKRQRTWFRHQPGLTWRALETPSDAAGVADEIVSFLRTPPSVPPPM